MTGSGGEKSLRDLIFSAMREKETDDLLEIWEENDREGWTQDAFDAIQTILLERLGEVPEQGQGDDEDEDAEIRIRAVEYPGDNKLIWLADVSNRLSWVILAVAVINSAFQIGNTIVSISPATFRIGTFIFQMFTALVYQINNLVYAGFTFLVLQAITEVVYLLMELREMVSSEDDTSAEMRNVNAT